MFKVNLWTHPWNGRSRIHQHWNTHVGRNVLFVRFFEYRILRIPNGVLGTVSSIERFHCTSLRRWGVRMRRKKYVGHRVTFFPLLRLPPFTFACDKINTMHLKQRNQKLPVWLANAVNQLWKLNRTFFCQSSQRHRREVVSFHQPFISVTDQ